MPKSYDAHFYSRYISSLLKGHVGDQVGCAKRNFYKAYNFSEINFKKATFLVWLVFKSEKILCQPSLLLRCNFSASMCDAHRGLRAHGRIIDHIKGLTLQFQNLRFQ
jgi:hypothetical protein